MREVQPGVFRLPDGRLATRNLVPGSRVYDEELRRARGGEVRTWNPGRSKLAAALLKGLSKLPVRPGGRVLYLGAGNGTTVSHVSDILGPEGLVVAVEFSPRTMRDLLEVAEPRGNLLPVLGDAWKPSSYRHVVGSVDAVVQDVAQRDQARILLRNLDVFQPEQALLSIKTRSVDVARDPEEVIADQVKVVEDGGWPLVEGVRLDPYEKDHGVAVFRREG